MRVVAHNIASMLENCMYVQSMQRSAGSTTLRILHEWSYVCPSVRLYVRTCIRTYVYIYIYIYECVCLLYISLYIYIYECTCLLVVCSISSLSRLRWWYFSFLANILQSHIEYIHISSSITIIYKPQLLLPPVMAII